MEANLLGAEPSARALHQPEHGEGDQRRPQSDGHQQDDQQTDVEPFGSGGGLIDRRGGRLSEAAGRLTHRASTLLLLGGIGLIQLVWVAVLAYGTYALWQRLPF